ncbi:hypothetical protein MML48_2g00004590 [Holotrichia oblita]|uniref:Uncharacterized protein n=2 Tax=Holotrichia oblita TaxID=644536 RepID=A0ACB9TK73_HOLOL|nr:hypothetical protein MML48_2g00021576 [Holotrichia oblita]KAI4467242.1 hypothetical protein MML48_2g00004590 [Holotrichia oblita]
MTNSELLSPGENIRPQLTMDQAKQLVTKYYGFECESISELDGYDDKNFKVAVRGNHEQDKNEQYVLKILNSLDSRTVDFIEGQNELLLYLFNKNITCPVPQPTITKSYYTIVQLESGKHIVRLMNYITGVTLLIASNLPDYIFSQIGTFTSNLDNVMKICIEARICQSLTMGVYTSSLDPGNAYVLTTSKPGWKVLREMRSMTNEELFQKWRELPLVE